MKNWPVFVCYRQSDGMTAAARVFDLLHDQIVQVSAKSDAQEPPAQLDVYYDQAAPGVEDWTEIHEPFLKRSRAIIVICTPGSKLNEGEEDWVHREIDWWLENREMAPILVDPLAEGLRYVPSSIAEKWPNAQRIKIVEKEWAGGPDSDRQSLEDRVREQFLGAIIPSGKNFYRQELEKEKKREARLLRIRKAAITLGTAFIAVLGLAAWSLYLKDIADHAKNVANQAALEAQAAHRLAQSRVVEGQAARTRTESGLLKILQKFPQYDAYKQDLEHWEKEFAERAKALSLRVSKQLPHCELIGGGSVYEGQLVRIELTGLPEHEALFVYLSTIPGSSPRPGDWAPAVLDVFFSDTREISPKRDFKRKAVRDIMENIAPENQWGLLMGLGTPHVLTHQDRNYRLRRRGINMNDEGDMVMGFDICQETMDPKNME